MKFLIATLLATATITGTVRASLTGASHTPKINVHWPYTVRVTDNGKPASARITAQIVDPVGGVHPVEFGKGTKAITNWRIKGVFRDYIIWPPSARGVPLKLRIIVVSGKVRKVLSYSVVPHA